MRRNNKFGAKNINLATTIGERKIASNFFFVGRRNRHLRLQVIASCRLMVINVYLNCQLTPQLSTWTHADNLGPSINVYWVRVITYGDRHTLLTAATGNGHNYRLYYTWCHAVHEINCTIIVTSLPFLVNNNSHYIAF